MPQLSCETVPGMCMCGAVEQEVVNHFLSPCACQTLWRAALAYSVQKCVERGIGCCTSTPMGDLYPNPQVLLTWRSHTWICSGLSAGLSEPVCFRPPTHHGSR